MYELPRDCTREDLDRAWAALTPYSATTWVLSGGGLHQRSAATHKHEDVVYAQLRLARKAEYLTVATQKIWVVICPDATPLWRTSVAKCDTFVHCWGDGIRAASDIHRWAMWFCPDGPDDGACLVTIDLEAKLSEQVHHLQSECTYYFEGVRKEFGRPGAVYVWVVVDVLLCNFTSLYGLWKERVPLTAAQISAPRAHTAKIGECWVKMGWEPSSWVHWVVAHFAALLKRYGTLYIFSSIPSEHRHKPFKVVVKNSFRGWCLQRPRVSRRGLGHVMGMEALDIGLRRQAARDNLERREAIRDRRKRHCHFV